MTGITVSIWHNVARDQAGRHTAPLDGFTPGDPMVGVFTYQATPRGRPPEVIAEDAFALANGHPPRPWRHGAVPPVLREATEVTVVPRKNGRVAAGDVAFIVASCGRVMGQRRYVA
jgi:hypothetical protein